MMKLFIKIISILTVSAMMVFGIYKALGYDTMITVMPPSLFVWYLMLTIEHIFELDEIDDV